MMTALLLIVGAYVALLVTVAYVSLHPPRIPLFLSPGAMGAEQKPTEFDGPKGRLRGWWMDQTDPEWVVVCVHGYLQNRSELVPVAWRLWHRGLACLTFDLRGHGRSSGRGTTLGWLERADVAAAVRHARSRYPGARVLVVGSSMGAAAALFAAADDPTLVHAVVADSCYARLPETVFGWWRFLGGRRLQFVFAPMVPITFWMLGFDPRRADVSRALQRVVCPVLFLHGEADVIAPPAAARRNVAAARAGRIVWLEGCDHAEGRWEQHDLYFEAIEEFLREVDFGQVEELALAGQHDAAHDHTLGKQEDDQGR